MAEWALKRFWKTTDIEVEDSGYSVRLDGRMVRTPAKTQLIVPTEALAQAVAQEWDAQEDGVRPETMPFTRMSNAALDKVAPQKREVADMLAAYGETDLLCYRATSPQELIDRQASEWDPLLAWAEKTYGARLVSGAGVMPVTQDPAAVAALAEPVHALDPFTLAGFHDLVSLSGSLVIGLAALEEAYDAADLWRRSRIDEIWQEEKWGEDEEATEHAALRARAFLDAHAFCKYVAPVAWSELPQVQKQGQTS